jgi:16S rRNA processing protein RimM
VSWRPERVRVGTVGKPHGLDGSFVVDAPCGWFAFGGGDTVLAAGTPRQIRRRAGTDQRPLIALVGTDDHDAARSLRGAPLEVSADTLPQPDPDHWFRFDLVGCDAYQHDRLLGRVVRVEDGVAHDVLVLDSGLRLPFVAAVITAVAVDRRRLDVTEDLAVE